MEPCTKRSEGDKEYMKIMYEPCMYWLSQSRIELEKLRSIAKDRVERTDICEAITKLLSEEIYRNETITASLSFSHRLELAEIMSTRRSGWRDWRHIADFAGYTNTQIVRVQSLERNSMKTILYLYDKHGEMTIDRLKFFAKKCKLRKCHQNELEKTIRGITYSKWQQKVTK